MTAPRHDWRGLADRMCAASRTPLPLVVVATPDTTVAHIQARAGMRRCLIAVNNPDHSWTLVRWEQCDDQ